MISIATLLLAVSTAQTSESIFTDGFDSSQECPETISSPRGTLTLRQVADISYLPGNPPPTRHNVDITQFDNIWGHLSPTDATVPWPGRRGASSTVDELGKNEFFAAKFHVPADASMTLSGSYKNVMYGYGPNVDFSISEQCGDFEPPQDACWGTDFIADDTPMVYWRLASATNYYCHLDRDRDYYVNIRFTDSDPNADSCDGNVCNTTIQHY